MPISTTVKVSCNHCGREPGRSEEIKKTAIEFGLGTDDDYDRILYGWIVLRPEHLCRDLGHNRIPGGEIVLCSDCWPSLAHLWEREKKKSNG